MGKGFKDLTVYSLAYQLAAEILRLQKLFQRKNGMLLRIKYDVHQGVFVQI